MRSAFRFVSNSTLAAAATLVVVLAPAPASADLEADVKSCQARETPPKERLVVCQKIIDSDVLNQKQMVVALYALGHTQLGLGKSEEAVASFGKAIKRAPKELSLFDSRSQALVRLRRFDAAIADLTRAIELKPEIAPLYSNRGNAYAGLGDHERALKDFEEAIRLSPDKLAQPYVGRGRSLMATGAH